jgi:hypothetical protein
MSDRIRCSSCDAAVERAFVHGARVRASCPRCAFQFDVRCPACRTPLADAVVDGAALRGRCPACQESFRIDGARMEPTGRVEKRETEPSPDGLVVKVRVETTADRTYREGAELGTLTVTIDDPEHEARMSAYRAARARYERGVWGSNRTPLVVLGMLVLAATMLVAFGALPGPAIVLTFVMTLGLLAMIVRRIVLAERAQREGPPLEEPKPPARRGGAVRISASGIELGDGSGAWLPAIEAGAVRGIRVEPDGTAYAIRVETPRGEVTLFEGVPEPTAADVTERLEAHLARRSRANEG